MGILADGRQTVTSAGTRVKLSAGTTDTATGPIKAIAVTALDTNTGVIVVGGASCVASSATRRGTPLYARDTATFATDDLADVYIDSTVNGEGVSFTFVYG